MANIICVKFNDFKYKGQEVEEYYREWEYQCSRQEFADITEYYFKEYLDIKLGGTADSIWNMASDLDLFKIFEDTEEWQEIGREVCRDQAYDEWLEYYEIDNELGKWADDDTVGLEELEENFSRPDKQYKDYKGVKVAVDSNVETEDAFDYDCKLLDNIVSEYYEGDYSQIISFDNTADPDAPDHIRIKTVHTEGDYDCYEYVGGRLYLIDPTEYNDFYLD